MVRYISMIVLASSNLLHRQAFAPTSMWQQNSKANIRALAYSEQADQFRNSFIYNNALYGVLGEVINRISGESFVDFIQKRIFDPLNMHSATYRPDPALVATPCISGPIQAHQVGLFTQWIDTNDCSDFACGGIFMTTKDACQWLSFLLNRTRPDNQSTQLISDEQLKAIMSPHNRSSGLMFPSLSPGIEQDDVEPMGYCTGFNKIEYQGHTIYEHFGAMLGVGCQFFFAPENGIGSIVFAPAAWTGNAVAFILAMGILEEALSLKQRDWAGILRQEQKFFNTALPPIDSKYQEERQDYQFLSYCGLYEASKGNRVYITSPADQGKPEIARQLFAQLACAETLHPPQDGFGPRLYLIHTTEPFVAIL